MQKVLIGGTRLVGYQLAWLLAADHPQPTGASPILH